MNIVFLGIGTNLGDRESNLKRGVEKIEEYVGKILESSSVYATEPWGFQSDNEFLNLILKVETLHSPSGLLERILLIEKILGRVRNEKKYTSRVIDIDILLYDDYIMDQKNLKIPHPRMSERRFVLVPLCEIAPEMVHPVLKMPFISLLILCKDKSKVKKYGKKKLD